MRDVYGVKLSEAKLASRLNIAIKGNKVLGKNLEEDKKCVACHKPLKAGSDVVSCKVSFGEDPNGEATELFFHSLDEVGKFRKHLARIAGEGSEMKGKENYAVYKKWNTTSDPLSRHNSIKAGEAERIDV